MCFSTMLMPEGVGDQSSFKTNERNEEGKKNHWERNEHLFKMLTLI